MCNPIGKDAAPTTPAVSRTNQYGITDNLL